MSRFFGSFARFGGLFAFMVLEIISFFLIIRYNEKQNIIFVHSANLFSGSVQKNYTDALSYIQLNKRVDSLADANAVLLEKLYNQAGFSAGIAPDTVASPGEKDLYHVTAATVINNSVSKNRNYFTLDKGSAQGVKQNLGVITEKGVAGIVRDVSPGYARVMSLLHRQMRLSVAVKRNGFFGTLVWEGTDPLHMTLEDVPKHAILLLQDTIVTSGYSSIFPPGVRVGVIEGFEVRPGSNFYTIDVKLSEDLSSISQVYVIENQDRKELEQLNPEVENE